MGKDGKQAFDEDPIAGSVKELNLGASFFSIHPIDIKEIKKTDLVNIPSVSYDYENIIRENKDLITWIREQYESGAEIASICTGTFLLAARGLQEGKCCSTHWNAATDFRRLFPNIHLHIDKLITAEREIYINGVLQVESVTWL